MLKCAVPEHPAKRRIDEDDVETRAVAREKIDGIGATDLYLLRPQFCLGAFQHLNRCRIRFDHDHMAGAARGSLEPQSATPRVEIETGFPGEGLSQPVEQGFPHPVRRRTQIRTAGDTQPSTAPDSTYDTQILSCAGTLRLLGRHGLCGRFARMRAHILAVPAALPSRVPVFGIGNRQPQKGGNSPEAAEKSAEKSSWATRLRAGLARTRAAIGGGLGALLGKQAVDEALFEELETALLGADCGIDATRFVLDRLRQRARKESIHESTALKEALKAILLELIEPLERSLDLGTTRPCVMMIAGVNGSGKTTSIGKLTKWLQGQGCSVLLAAGDTFRAAAREQLVTWGERNGVTVISQQGGDASAVMFDAVSAAVARHVDVMLADTAGRLPTQLNLMEEIRKVKRVIGKAKTGAPHEILLIVDANTGQNTLAQVRAFDEALGLTGLVLTKLDGTARGGIVAALAYARRNAAPGRPGGPVPLLFVGVGEGIDDLRPFVARDFVEALID